MEFEGRDHRAGLGKGVPAPRPIPAPGVGRALRGGDTTTPVRAQGRLSPLSLLLSQGPAGIRSRGEAERESFQRRAGRSSVPSRAPARCPRCRSLNDRRARFCDQCGRRLQAPAAPGTGLAQATRAAIERELRADAKRLAGREGMPIQEALDRVRSTPSAKALLTRYGGH